MIFKYLIQYKYITKNINTVLCILFPLSFYAQDQDCILNCNGDTAWLSNLPFQRRTELPHLLLKMDSIKLNHNDTLVNLAPINSHYLVTHYKVYASYCGKFYPASNYFCIYERLYKCFDVYKIKNKSDNKKLYIQLLDHIKSEWRSRFRPLAGILKQKKETILFATYGSSILFFIEGCGYFINFPNDEYIETSKIDYMAIDFTLEKNKNGIMFISNNQIVPFYYYSMLNKWKTLHFSKKNKL